MRYYVEKKYLGVLYENFTKTLKNNTTIIQGLLGRATGYDDNGETIVYTDRNTIDIYEQCLETMDFEKWKSNSRNKETFNSPTLVKGLESTKPEDKKEAAR